MTEATPAWGDPECADRRGERDAARRAVVGAREPAAPEHVEAVASAWPNEATTPRRFPPTVLSPARRPVAPVPPLPWA